ncbi:MAG: hypothetical protein RBQ71_02235 [Acholeplasmataceae bacterium]|jgi:hypothetical protein|nr:hypothetical protein [Acholeplasmataceae bacterium]
MKKLNMTMIIILCLFLISCEQKEKTIDHDIMTDEYFFDVSSVTNTINNFDDVIRVKVTLTARIEKKILLTETNDHSEELILQARFVHRVDQDMPILYQLYHDKINEPTTHDPKWIILKEGDTLEKEFVFSRISVMDDRSLVGPSGTYDLELAVFNGEELVEEDWIPTDFSIEVNRKEIHDKTIQTDFGIFNIDFYLTPLIDDALILVDIQFISSINQQIVLPNIYPEKDSAVMRTRFVLATDPSIHLYDQFSTLNSPALYPIDLKNNQILEKVCFYRAYDTSSLREDAPEGLYIFEIAFFQGIELSENDWIDTGITFNYMTS